MRDFEKIRAARDDITDYVIHWTNSLRTLKQILQCGYLVPTFAPKWSRSFGDTVGHRSNTIKGPHPAVCFTEQPLDSFCKSCNALSSRYSPYGVALRKDSLHDYGGRPVIYGDETYLGRRVRPGEEGYEEGKVICKDGLPLDLQYLWVEYKPKPDPTYRGYPLDWTHEREWRCRTFDVYRGRPITLPEKGVPILLPEEYLQKAENPTFRVIVGRNRDADDLRQWISQLPDYQGPSRLLRAYFDKLPTASIISLEEVRQHLEAGERDWARLETIPQEGVNSS